MRRANRRGDEKTDVRRGRIGGRHGKKNKKEQERAVGAQF